MSEAPSQVRSIKSDIQTGQGREKKAGRTHREGYLLFPWANNYRVSVSVTDNDVLSTGREDRTILLTTYGAINSKVRPQKRIRTFSERTLQRRLLPHARSRYMTCGLASALPLTNLPPISRRRGKERKEERTTSVRENCDTLPAHCLLGILSITLSRLVSLVQGNQPRGSANDHQTQLREVVSVCNDFQRVDSVPSTSPHLTRV